MTTVFQVDERVFERAPNYVVGCVLARGIDNSVAYPFIDALLDDAEEQALLAYAGVDLKQLPQIAIWREHFSALGWSPSRFPSSVEALLKRVARGDRLPRINPAVDLANAAVLRNVIPIGTHDVGTFAGAVLTVRPAEAGDTFRPMGAAESEAPEPGEIVYTVGSQIRTRRWVWRQSSLALIQPTAIDIFFPIDGFATTTSDAVEQAAAFIAEACRAHLGADVAIGLIERSRPIFEA